MVPGGLLPPSRSGSIPWGDPDIGGYHDPSSSVQQALGHDEQGAPGTASLLQTGSAGPPTCRATARTFWLYRCRRVKWRGSLIRRIISLMARFNSLLGRNKFPVPTRRELRHNSFKLLPNFEPLAGRRRPREQNSLYFPSLAGNLASETGFDCFDPLFYRL